MHQSVHEQRDTFPVYPLVCPYGLRDIILDKHFAHKLINVYYWHSGNDVYIFPI